MRIYSIIFLLALIAVANCYTCGSTAKIFARADNYVKVAVVHHGVQGPWTTLSGLPENPTAPWKWAYTYTTTTGPIQNGDIIRFSVHNNGGPGAFKANITIDGDVIKTQATSNDFYLNVPLSTGYYGTPTSVAITSYSFYGADDFSADTKWVWGSADGYNPTSGFLVFDFPMCCTQPEVIVSTGLTCGYEYWEYLALGYPYYHRSDLDSWCGPYPPQFSNCYDGALQIAPACTESYPNFSTIVAGDVSVDFNLRCFLKCTATGG